MAVQLLQTRVPAFQVAVPILARDEALVPEQQLGAGVAPAELHRDERLAVVGPPSPR
jgi:hypothetical protein